jgi:hypothetical protein
MRSSSGVNATHIRDLPALRKIPRTLQDNYKMLGDPCGTEISAIPLNPRLPMIPISTTGNMPWAHVRGQAPRRRIRPITVNPVASNSMLAGSGTARKSPNAKSLAFCTEIVIDVSRPP